MRKRLITPTPENIQTREDGWLDVEHAATIEITSEDKEFPIEAVFVSEVARGWRAATPGSQTIRLIFDQPAKGQPDVASFRGDRIRAHPGIRLALV